MKKTFPAVIVLSVACALLASCAASSSKKSDDGVDKVDTAVTAADVPALGEGVAPAETIDDAVMMLASASDDYSFSMVLESSMNDLVAELMNEIGLNAVASLRAARATQSETYEIDIDLSGKEYDFASANTLLAKGSYTLTDTETSTTGTYTIASDIDAAVDIDIESYADAYGSDISDFYIAGGKILGNASVDGNIVTHNIWSIEDDDWYTTRVDFEGSFSLEAGLTAAIVDRASNTGARILVELEIEGDIDDTITDAQMDAFDDDENLLIDYISDHGSAAITIKVLRADGTVAESVDYDLADFLAAFSGI